MYMQKMLLMAMVAALCFPVGIQAETTDELLQRLAKEANEASKNNPWVRPTDCQEEQAAVRAWRRDGEGSYGCEDRTGRDTEESISWSLEHPWNYRFSVKNDYGRLITAKELKSAAEDYAVSAENAEKQSHVYTRRHCEAALDRLKACAYRNAALRRDSVAPVSRAASKEKLQMQCAPDIVANANRELQEIDQRLAAFLESPAGQQTGSITPSLQVVMWGTKEQVRIIKRYCPTADVFQERINSLMSSFQSAQQACRTIQSGNNPKNCEPAAPQALIASYDKAQSEATSNRSVSSGGGSSSSASVSQSGNKSSSADSGCGPSGKGVCWAR